MDWITAIIVSHLNLHHCTPLWKVQFVPVHVPWWLSLLNLGLWTTLYSPVCCPNPYPSSSLLSVHNHCYIHCTSVCDKPGNWYGDLNLQVFVCLPFHPLYCLEKLYNTFACTLGLIIHTHSHPPRCVESWCDLVHADHREVPLCLRWCWRNTDKDHGWQVPFATWCL